MESPVSNVFSSPIPWPSSGKKKKSRHLVSKGLIKPSKLSSKYLSCSGKSSNPCCSPKLIITNVKRSGDKVFKDFIEDIQSAIIDCSSSSLSPSVIEDSSSDNKHVFHNNKLFGLKESYRNMKKNCAVQIVPQFSDTDSSPEPLIKRISGFKSPVLKENGSVELKTDTCSFKTPILNENHSSDHKTETFEKVLPKSTPNVLSVADPRRALLNAIFSSSDDEILPLSERITKTLPTKKWNRKYPPKGVKKNTVTLNNASSESSPTDSPILFPNLDSDPSPIIENRKKVFKTSRIIISSDTDSSLELKISTKSKKLVKKPTEIKKSTDGKKTVFKEKPGTFEPNVNKLLITKTPVSKFKTINNFESRSPSSRGQECSLKEANTFVASLSENYPKNDLHPDAAMYVKNFSKKKEDLAYFLYSIYNKHVFENQLPPKMVITWKPRMTHTAGFCTFRKRIVSSVPGTEIRTATIDLSIKVLDAPDRLRDTLVHEMCHAATWIISGIKDAHHGMVWKNWCALANRTLPSLPPIKRTHNYPIKTKYIYRCTQCAGSIGRHSKSLDITRKVCGRCRGRFELLVNGKVVASAVTNSGKISNPTLTPFAKYVKENYKVIKQNDPHNGHADIMKQLGKNFMNKLNLKDF